MGLKKLAVTIGAISLGYWKFLKIWIRIDIATAMAH